MRTLRELELEQENARLRQRCLELFHMMNLPPSPHIRPFEPNEMKVVHLSGPIPHDFKAVVDCSYSADPFSGWEINVTGYPNKALWRWQYQYRVTEPELVGWERMPELLSREHEKFQRHLIKHLNLGSRTKAVVAS